jgi:hypothetical protein
LSDVLINICVSQDIASLGKFPHNEAFSALSAFVDASGLAMLTIAGCEQVQTGSRAMPSADGLSVLRVLNTVRDTSALSAILQSHFLDPLANSKGMAKAEVFGNFTFWLVLLQKLVSQLDLDINSKQMMDIERAGWQTPIAPATVRQWRALVSIFAGRCLDLLLKQYVSQLMFTVMTCKAACPSWEAAFANEALNLPLALKIVKGKMANIVALHNVVHKDLADMNFCAKLLEVTPRLQDHEATSEAIAVGLACLKQASQASVLMSGVELLASADTDPSGGDKAKFFVQKHKLPRNAGLPAVFWNELEHMAAGLTVPGASAPNPALPTPGHKAKQHSDLGAIAHTPQPKSPGVSAAASHSSGAKVSRALSPGGEAAGTTGTSLKRFKRA